MTILGYDTVPLVKYSSIGSVAAVGSAGVGSAEPVSTRRSSGVQPLPGDSPTTILCRSVGRLPATESTLAAPSESVMAPTAAARAMRYSMSFPVSRLVPGMGMAPMRMAPRAATYHCGMRGSMMKKGSPFFTPCPRRALPIRRVSRAISAQL